MSQKRLNLTPWFPNGIKPVRVGVYEIQGTRFRGQNYRHWDGCGWSETYRSPVDFCQSEKLMLYKHGQDMTGWRGIEK